MSKSFGKFILFTAVAGAAAYGAYSYLQKKEQTASFAPGEEDDDFDDFSEDLDEDLNLEKERSYVSLNLDKAEAIATEAFHKAKEVIAESVQQVKETVKSVADAQGYHTSFTDLTEPSGNEESAKSTSDTARGSVPDDAKEPAAQDQTASEDAKAEDSPEAPSTASAADTAAKEEQVEEFFDDEDTVE